MQTHLQIPLFNPSQELVICGDRIDSAIGEILRSGTYVNGPQVQRFEQQIAARWDHLWAIGVASGTTALELMLRAGGVEPGMTVVTSAHTFVAVVEAILHVGAEPLLVDIDPQTWQMPAGCWPNSAVLVSHLYGGASPAVRSMAWRVFEDASQSFGGTLDGHYLGTLGYAGAVSLYPTKNLSAVGDAGLILTADEQLAAHLCALRNHGQTMHQTHTYCGTTGRMDEVQAAVLAIKLQHFEAFLASRRQAALTYRNGLADLPLKLPETTPASLEAPNLFVIRSPLRDQLRAHLKSRGVATGIHYPAPIHHMPAYHNQPWAQVDLPHTEALCREILTLPLWAGIAYADQQCIIRAIREFFGADGHAG